MEAGEQKFIRMSLHSRKTSKETDNLFQFSWNFSIWIRIISSVTHSILHLHLKTSKLSQHSFFTLPLRGNIKTSTCPLFSCGKFGGELFSIFSQCLKMQLYRALIQSSTVTDEEKLPRRVSPFNEMIWRDLSP